ncbi:DUF2723 domain-containing protein [candidate division KSB1 bacterium]|nr:DUF2723 domain-containing protein [candidate division KSB1 bacterium]NIU24511.1 DUF2723 domain-containing protein [candidate division KSB1 bacterium]NIW18377.1 DUF2723 domain-containing protein [candidate division KSB1 bacterium]NIW68874.1 DUF2723 domain-containing protein [candidate division KSB1 bacterium]
MRHWVTHEIQWSRPQRWAAISSFVLPLAIYIYFLCPTIAAGDSPELITAAKILGIPHPPGYPLFTLIGHVFTWLPINSVAWRVNLSSTVFCALTCLFVYLSLLRLTGRIWPALAGAFGLALSRYFWHYAEVAEVFPMNNFFAALLTYVLIVIRDNVSKAQPNEEPALREPPNPSVLKSYWLLSFLFGLALSNHHTIILLAPAGLFFLWKTAPNLLRNARIVGMACLFFVVGLTSYLYCPLAAIGQPLINWDNPVTLENFLRLILRVDYGSFSPFASQSTVPRLSQVPTFFTSLYHQFTIPGILLAALGLLNFKRHKLFQGYLGLAFFFSGIFFVVYANVPINNLLLFGVLHRFYILPAIIFSFWIGLGLEQLLEWLTERKWPQLFPRVAPILLILILSVWQFMANVEEADFRENYVAEDFAHNLLMSLPQDALFFVRGDVASMGVDYLQMVDDRRPDVKTLDQTKLTYDWYYAQAKKRFPEVKLPGERYDGRLVQNRELIEKNIGRFPVCFMDFKEESYQQKFKALPHGLVYKMHPKTQGFSVEKFETITNECFAEFKRRGLDQTYPPTTFENELQQIYAEPYFRLGYEFEQVGNFKKADTYYTKSLTLNPNNHRVLKNLAVLYYYKLNRKAEAVTLFKRYLKLNPYDPEAHNIEQIIESFEESHSE